MIETTPDSKAYVVGPMDPDNTAELTARYGVGNNALELLVRQADNQPPELMSALVMPPDDERSQALVLDEVIKASGGLLEREGTQLRAAYVRGKDPWSQVVTVTYTVASGRVGKALLGKYRDNFPESQAAYERVARARMGLSAADAALLANAPNSGGGDVPPDSPEAGGLRELVNEMQSRFERERQEDAAKREALEGELEKLRNPEPVAGYADLNVKDAADRVASMDDTALDATIRYEEGTGKPRQGVYTAIEARREELERERSELAELRAARDAANT